MNSKSKLGPIAIASIMLLFAAHVAFAQVDWTWGSLVVPPGPPGSWDPGGHVLGDVVFDGALYHMYLLGGEGPDPLDYSWSVGHWTSPDKVNWTPDDENPVLDAHAGRLGRVQHHPRRRALRRGDVPHVVRRDGCLPGLGSMPGTQPIKPGSVAWDKIAGPLPGLGPGIPAAWNERGPSASTVLFDGVDPRHVVHLCRGKRVGHVANRLRRLDRRRPQPGPATRIRCSRVRSHGRA